VNLSHRLNTCSFINGVITANHDILLHNDTASWAVYKLYNSCVLSLPYILSYDSSLIPICEMWQD